MKKTYYEILEVRDDASAEVIDMAYKALMKKYHPDVYKGDPAFAHDITQEINEAHATLSDETLRQEYDASLPTPKHKDKSGGIQSAVPGSFFLRPRLLWMTCGLLLILCAALLISTVSLRSQNDTLSKQNLQASQDLKSAEAALSARLDEYAKLQSQNGSMAEYLDHYYSKACFTANFSSEYHRYGCSRTVGRTLTILDKKNAERLGYTPCSECWDKGPEELY